MIINFHQAKQFVKHFFSAKRNGHGIHSPFAYQLCEEVFYNDHAFYDFIALNKIRKELYLNGATLEIKDFGAGSKTFKSTTRKIKDIAARGISSSKQSELIYKLMNFLKCRNAIELGTSLGLNTLYMASVDKKTSVISIEGSKALSEFAGSLAQRNGIYNILFINSVFEAAFPKALNDLAVLDFLYVDGNHTYTATISYFHQALEKKHNFSVFIFDDIYWSPDMTKAWKEIKKHPSVTLSIDTFYSGIVFFRKEIKEKVDLKFYLP